MAPLTLEVLSLPLGTGLQLLKHPPYLLSLTLLTREGLGREHGIYHVTHKRLDTVSCDLRGRGHTYYFTRLLNRLFLTVAASSRGVAPTMRLAGGGGMEACPLARSAGCADPAGVAVLVMREEHMGMRLVESRGHILRTTLSIQT